MARSKYRGPHGWCRCNDCVSKGFAAAVLLLISTCVVHIGIHGKAFPWENNPGYEIAPLRTPWPAAQPVLPAFSLADQAADLLAQASATAAAAAAAASAGNVAAGILVDGVMAVGVGVAAAAVGIGAAAGLLPDPEKAEREKGESLDSSFLYMLECIIFSKHHHMLGSMQAWDAPVADCVATQTIVCTCAHIHRLQDSIVFCSEWQQKRCRLLFDNSWGLQV